MTSQTIQNQINSINSKIDAIDPRYIELSKKYDDAELTEAEGDELLALAGQAFDLRAERQVLSDQMQAALFEETGFIGAGS